MYILNYIPVKMNGTVIVYSDKYNYTLDELECAVDHIKKKGDIKQNDEDDMFVYTNNYITNKETNVRWCITDVYLAYEAYQIANENNFYFRCINNQDGIPQILLSKEFKKTCIVVNLLSMQALLVKDIAVNKHLSSLLYKNYDSFYLTTLFTVLIKREQNKSSILNALILWRDTEEESLIVNPVLSAYSECDYVYSHDVIESYQKALDREDYEDDYIKREGDVVTHKTGVKFKVPLKHCRDILNTYQQYKDKKNNYDLITSTDYESQFYVSTNMMYIVDAFTFECFKITNNALRDELEKYLEGKKLISTVSAIAIRSMLQSVE